MKNKQEFYKIDEEDKVWWLDDDSVGNHVFSFDKKTTYNLFKDYPSKLKKEELEIFDREYPQWAEYFKNK